LRVFRRNAGFEGQSWWCADFGWLPEPLYGRWYLREPDFLGFVVPEKAQQLAEHISPTRLQEKHGPRGRSVALLSPTTVKYEPGPHVVVNDLPTICSQQDVMKRHSHQAEAAILQDESARAVTGEHAVDWPVPPS